MRNQIYNTLFFFPLIIGVLMFLISILVGVAGHSAGIEERDYLLVLVFFVVYAWLNRRLYSKKHNTFEAYLWMVINSGILFFSGYYVFMILTGNYFGFLEIMFLVFALLSAFTSFYVIRDTKILLSRN